MNDEFGDRMKLLEGMESNRIFLPQLPVCARIDGKCFSKFTKGMERPYDIRMSNLMVDTTKYLVEETNARCGYTQSDEISLVWYEPNFKSQIFFNGRIQKMVSVLASMATLQFNRLIPIHFLYHNWLEYTKKSPVFDCRVWQVPNITEAANTFLWRELDASRNSIEMSARHYYSHNECKHKNGNQLQEMLFQKGINWNGYPRFFKRGTFLQKRIKKRKFTTDELEKLPPKHEARTNPDLEIERSQVVELDMPPFSKVTNREGVIFFGEDPVTEQRKD